MAVTITKPGEAPTVAEAPPIDITPAQAEVATDNAVVAEQPAPSTGTTADVDEEVLNVTPPENAVAETPVSQVAKEAAAPTPWVPTAQQAALAASNPEFANLDMRLYNVQCYRTVGTPVVNAVEQTKKVNVPGTPAVEAVPEVKDEAGNITQAAVEAKPAVPDSFREEKITVNQVSHTWGTDRELLGDPHPSLTAALRAQKELAKTNEKEGLSVKEYLSKEYGVWYATDEAGKKPGYRYTVMPVTAPAKPAKQVDPDVAAKRAAKQLEQDKKKADREAAKAAKAAAADGKKAKAGTKAAATETTAATVAAQSDPVVVEIAE